MKITRSKVKSVPLPWAGPIIFFTGSHRSGELASIIYSFMATCKRQKIDHAKWLGEVLRRIPDKPEGKLIEIQPQFCKPPLAQNAKSA